MNNNRQSNNSKDEDSNDAEGNDAEGYEDYYAYEDNDLVLDDWDIEMDIRTHTFEALLSAYLRKFGAGKVALSLKEFIYSNPPAVCPHIEYGIDRARTLALDVSDYESATLIDDLEIILGLSFQSASRDDDNDNQEDEDQER